MNLPDCEMCILREHVDGNIPWSQIETIHVSEAEGSEDAAPDWAAIRAALGVSNQTKAQNVAGYLLARLLGI